jgi:hypothetical protein
LVRHVCAGKGARHGAQKHGMLILPRKQGSPRASCLLQLAVHDLRFSNGRNGIKILCCQVLDLSGFNHVPVTDKGHPLNAEPLNELVDLCDPAVRFLNLGEL